MDAALYPHPLSSLTSTHHHASHSCQTDQDVSSTLELWKCYFQMKKQRQAQVFLPHLGKVTPEAPGAGATANSDTATAAQGDVYG